MKKISVLFTQKYDWLAKLLLKVCGYQYSHASLSLGNEDNIFYSFNVNGFCKESSEKFKRYGVKNSLLYETYVDNNVYYELKRKVAEIDASRNEMKYSYLGVFFCLIKIPFSWKNHYFCSQFVAEMLVETGAVKLKKKSSLYVPEQLKAELERQCNWTKTINII